MIRKGIFSVLVVLFTLTQGSAQTEKKKKAVVKSVHDFADSVKYDKNVSKDSINCAPALPKVKADDVTYSKRVWRDVFFAENSNKYLVAAEPKKNIIRIILDE